jgi:poly-beta-1,6-N-acetyl-D-glucosamine synthase
MSQRLLVVSPVRNEAAHIERVARAVAAQTRPPDLWLVVDDSSDDGTREILNRLEPELPFMRVISAPQAPETKEATDRLAVAAEARAFNHALSAVPWREFTHLGKLDGDVELPSAFFERLLEEFARRPQLGVAGGLRKELQGKRWQVERVPDYHVPGGMKFYSRECFEAIGGMEDRLGWDTIDETYARMRGYETANLRDQVAVHHRPWGSADGQLRGRARHGECAYIVRYGPVWTLMKSLRLAATARPRVLSGLAFEFGYLRAAVRSSPKVEDEEFHRFVRGELRRRVVSALRVMPA